MGLMDEYRRRLLACEEVPDDVVRFTRYHELSVELYTYQQVVTKRRREVALRMRMTHTLAEMSAKLGLTESRLFRITGRLPDGDPRRKDRLADDDPRKRKRAAPVADTV